jgi:hypothetical protein
VLIAVAVIAVLTDELPTLIFVVETLTFAPTLIPVVAFAVVVLRSPFKAVRPVTVNVLASLTAPATFAAPLTCKGASGVLVVADITDQASIENTVNWKN